MAARKKAAPLAPSTAAPAPAAVPAAVSPAAPSGLPPASSLAAAEGLKPERLAMLVQLQARFAAGLPERLAAIQAAAGDPAEQAMLLHRLAGAAGSFGLGDVSEAARRAERLAHPVADGLAEALAQLESLIQSKLGPA